MRNRVKIFLFKEQGSSGDKRLTMFLEDALNLSLRKPQSLSVVRNHGFTREDVNFSVSILEWEILNVKPSSNRIFNIY